MVFIGTIAVTLVMGYVALVLASFALMTFGGFDEVNIPAGIGFLFLLGCDLALWWFLVGQYIKIGWK